MRVLCVRSSFSKNNKVVLVKRGCYYNVTKIKKDTYHNDEQCDIWYVLLETGGSMHISTLFVLAPDQSPSTKKNNNKILIDKELLSEFNYN